MTSVSVIGCGNMGGALIRGLARSGEHDITGCDPDPDALATVESHATRTTTDATVAAEAAVVFIAVKPDLVGTVLSELSLDPDQTLVTIAAGVTTDFVAARTDAQVVRIMPNLAAETGNMAAAVTGSAVEPPVTDLLAELGAYVEIEEHLMDVATALNGSGPAFVFYLVKAMRDAAVAQGLDEADAEVLAAQTFRGAAVTIQESDESIGSLIEAVCSPKGTTIEGMAVLRNSDVTDVIDEALTAAAVRSRELAEETANE